jgi:hypothetical protein
MLGVMRILGMGGVLEGVLVVVAVVMHDFVTAFGGLMGGCNGFNRRRVGGYRGFGRGMIMGVIVMMVIVFVRMIMAVIVRVVVIMRVRLVAMIVMAVRLVVVMNSLAMVPGIMGMRVVGMRAGGFSLIGLGG